MDKLTINSGIALQNALKSRISELKYLRDKVAVKEVRSFYGEPKTETVVEPQFDVKKVDTKITKLENVIFRLNASIKEANAKTPLGLELDVDELLSPLE